MTNRIDESSDYVLETYTHQLQINRDLGNVIIEQMESESDLIIQSLEAMHIVGEAVAAVTDTADKKKSIFRRIIDFIKNIFKTFTDKVRKLFQTDQEWLTDNTELLGKINYDGLEIQMVPFWEMPVRKIGAEVLKLQTETDNLLKNPQMMEKYKDAEALKDEFFPHLMDDNGEITEGMKDFLRTGNAKGGAKPMDLSGANLKKVVLTEMIPYCQGYSNNVQNLIGNGVKKLESILSFADTKLTEKQAEEQKAQTTKENFCLIENALFGDTELLYCDNFILMEADENNNQNNNQNNNNNANNNEQKKENKPEPNQKPDDKKQPSPTSVTVNDHGDAKTQETKQSLNNMSAHQLTIAKASLQMNQTMLTAAMTVVEERYISYIKALKQIVSARKNTVQAAK